MILFVPAGELHCLEQLGTEVAGKAREKTLSKMDSK
jgi:hypothetical protein